MLDVTTPEMLGTALITAGIQDLKPAKYRKEFLYSCLQLGSSFSLDFTPDYIGYTTSQVIKLSSSITSEVEIISSLIDIGNILFKDSRDILPDELAAMRSYMRKKYKKIRK